MRRACSHRLIRLTGAMCPGHRILLHDPCSRRPSIVVASGGTRIAQPTDRHWQWPLPLYGAPCDAPRRAIDGRATVRSTNFSACRVSHGRAPFFQSFTKIRRALYMLRVRSSSMDRISVPIGLSPDAARSGAGAPRTNRRRAHTDVGFPYPAIFAIGLAPIPTVATSPHKARIASI